MDARTQQRNRRSRAHSSSSFLYISWVHVLVGILFPFFIVPLLFYRWLLPLLARILRPDLSHMLRGQGANFLCDSVASEPNMNILGSLHIAGSLNVEETKELISKRIVNVPSHPELHQYCVKWGGYFFWKQEANFSLDQHIQVHALAPGEDLGSIKAAYLAEPLPEFRSPWQILLVDASRSYYILVKSHHSLGDGHSLLQLGLGLADPDPPVVTLDLNRDRDRAKRQPLATQVILWLTTPFRLLSEFVSMITTQTECGPWPWPQFPPEPFAGGERRHVHLDLDSDSCAQSVAAQGLTVMLTDVKSIAAQHGVSTTSVLYGALTGALRNYLVSKCSNRPGQQKQIPETLTFSQPVPVPHHPQGLFNSLCGVTFRLPIGEPDPVRRLLATHRMIENRKRSLEPQLSFGMLQALSILPYNFPGRIRLSSVPLSIGTINLAGPLKPVAVNGRPFLGFDFQLAAPPFLLHICMASYNGQVRWSVSGDARLFTGQGELIQFGRALKDEFDVLRKVCPLNSRRVEVVI